MFDAYAIGSHQPVAMEASPCGISGGQGGTDGFFSEYFGFPLLLLFNQCSIHIYFSITDAMGLSMVRCSTHATRQDFLDLIPSRLGNFQASYSFCPHSVALGSTQPLTDMHTRGFSLGVKNGQHAELSTLPS